MAQALRQRIAPLINKVQQTVTPVYSATEKQLVQQYDKIMKGGEQYVVKDKAHADKLLKQWFYTNMSRYEICSSRPHLSYRLNGRTKACISSCRIPEGLKEAKQDWGTVQNKWTQRRDLPMTEVGNHITGHTLDVKTDEVYRVYKQTILSQHST